MGDDKPAPGEGGGTGDKPNEAKAHCSTPSVLSDLGITFPVGFKWKSPAVSVKAVAGSKYIQKCDFSIAVEVKAEIAFKPLAGAEKEDKGTLWGKFVDKLKEGKYWDSSTWKWGEPKLEGPEISGGAEKSGTEESGKAFEARLVGGEINAGPFGKISLEFDIASFSDKKWSGPQFSGGTAWPVETPEFHPFSAWLCAAASAELSLSFDVTPNYKAIYDVVKDQLEKAGEKVEDAGEQLWKTVSDGAEAYVTADGIVASCLIAGVVLTVAITWAEIQSDELVRATTDAVEKNIELAQSQYLNGLLTPFGDTGGPGGPYYTQGHKDRFDIFTKMDTWMGQQQTAKNIPDAQQLHALTVDASAPSGATENPEAATWFNNYINANAKTIKGNALANVATQVIKKAWADYAKANPASGALSLGVFSAAHTVFTNLACSRPAEWTTYFPNMDFPAPFGTKTYVDNFAYTQCYPNDSSGHS